MANTVKVLLVDDDEDYHVLTKDVLSEIEGGHFALEWASTYEAGIEAIRRDQSDVCLVDFRLGARNGLEWCARRLHSAARLP